MTMGMALLPACRCALRHKGKGEPQPAPVVHKEVRA